jgi:hypothetical protein
MNSAELKERIQAAVRQSPSRTRADVTREKWLVALGSLAVALGLYMGFDGPRHGEGRPTWFFASSIATWVVVASASMWGASGSGRSALGRSRPWLLAIAFGTPALLLGVSLVMAYTHPEVTVLGAEKIGFKCLGLTFAAAACPLIGLAIVRRSSDPVHGRLAGAALGAASGASAGVMVQLWCPVAAPAHVLFGHILPIVVLGVAGAILGKRVIAMP